MGKISYGDTRGVQKIHYEEKCSRLKQLPIDSSILLRMAILEPPRHPFADRTRRNLLL
jgi:hypothetical protein